MSLIPFSRYKVVGHSMEPTFREGRVVWVSNWSYLVGKPKVGDVVVAKHSAGRILLKRIIEVSQKGVVVVGDNQGDSLDSRTFGEIKFNQIVGKVLIKV